MSKWFTKKEIADLDVFQKKDRIQMLAYSKWNQNNCLGLVAAATGTGKSRIAIIAAEDKAKNRPDCNILLVVPTEKLRDKNWKDEFEKWGALDVYTKNVERTCYASLHKIEHCHYSLVILDEAHNITELNSNFFANNTWHSVLALTATQPKEREKRDILNAICPTVFVYTLDEGVEDGIVTPYEVFIIYTILDDRQRLYEVKLKDRESFFVTETKKYEFLCKQIDATRQKLAELGDKVKEVKIDNITISKEKLDKYTKLKKKDFDTFINVLPIDDIHKQKLGEYRENKQKLEFFENRHKFQMLERMRFIYNLRSKTEAAKVIIERFCQQRTLIFCGSIKEAEELGGENCFHSKTKSVAFDKFNNKEIDKLFVVEALNEGHNMVDVYMSLIRQVNSNQKDLIQRIGRNVRFMEDMIASIFIICCKGTQDESWVDKCIHSLDPKKIFRLNIEDVIAM